MNEKKSKKDRTKNHIMAMPWKVFFNRDLPSDCKMVYALLFSWLPDEFEKEGIAFDSKMYDGIGRYFGFSHQKVFWLIRILIEKEIVVFKDEPILDDLDDDYINDIPIGDEFKYLRSIV